MARGRKPNNNTNNNIDLRELFEVDDELGVPNGVGVDDMEDVYDIDIDLITKDADTLAASNVQNLLRLYNNKEFADTHPDFKRRIDTEIESLRKLYKMAKVNDYVHDHLVKSIAKSPDNASLYLALDRMQGKILAVDKQIRDQIASFNKIITAYQMELNFAMDNEISNNNTTTNLDDGSIMTRGSKSFVEQMKAFDNQDNQDNQEEQMPNQLSLFEEDSVENF